jgi:hypothetical protein
VSYSNSEKRVLSEIGDARLVFGAQGAGGYVQRDAVACGLWVVGGGAAGGFRRRLNAHWKGEARSRRVAALGSGCCTGSVEIGTCLVWKGGRGGFQRRWSQIKLGVCTSPESARARDSRVRVQYGLLRLS